MRPKIMSCHNIIRSITYNEQKVQLGKAECLAAVNFLKETSRLSQDDKLSRFQRRMELNDRVSTNLHITLNFDPRDNLSNETMKLIAREFMKDIGFGNQPFIVYRHTDAGHPHCHIVTTHVQKNGDPIDLYKIGQNQSEKARLRLEAEFGLITAEMKKELREQQRKSVEPHNLLHKDPPTKVIYGKESTAKAMSAVLEHVTEKYKYTSLQDLNTILRLYNMAAYTGKEDTKLYQNRGILYRALDENGSYIGRPLKASFFDCKPTLDNLEKKFALNQSLKEECRQYADFRISWALRSEPDGFEEFKESLRQERITIVLDLDRAGNCKQVSYVDFNHYSVWNSKDLNRSCNEQDIQKMLERQKILDKSQHLAEDLRQDLRQSRGLRM